MSAFGPPPGPAVPERPRRPPSYLPPGGLASRGLTSDRRYAVTTSHRPGIIPLKPLGLGDVLDASTKHTRRNPGTVLGLAAVTNAVAMVPAVLLGIVVLTGSWYQRSGASAVVNAQSAGTLLLLAGTALATLALVGVLAPSVGEAILGRRLDFTDARRAVRPRLGPVLASALVVCAALTVPWALVVVGVALAARGSVPLIIAVSLVLGGAATAVVAWLVPKLLLAPAAAVLERLGTRGALKRAWTLSRGRYLSIAGTTLLAGLLTTVLFFVLQLPLAIVGSLLVDLIGLPYPMRPGADQLVASLSTLGAAVLVTPFLATTVILQYVDARMRKEGLDLVLLRRTTTRTGAGR